jgi:hypothetical protein
MTSRALLASVIAAAAAMLIAGLWWKAGPKSNLVAIEPPVATSSAGQESPSEIAPPAADAPPRDEQAPPKPEPATQDVTPQDPPEQVVWQREAEGKTPEELRALASARWQTKLTGANPSFDELYEAGDFEIIDEEPPLEYHSRPEDKHLIVQARGNGSQMVRLVLPEVDHEELYGELRRYHWMMEEADRQQAESRRNP